MSNTHISVEVLELLKHIRNLEGALDRKSRTELDSMYSSADAQLTWIKDQAKDHNQDLSPYFSQLDQADIDLIRLKGAINAKSKTLWEAVWN